MCLQQDDVNCSIHSVNIWTVFSSFHTRLKILSEIYELASIICTWLAVKWMSVVWKIWNRPTVAASLKRDLVRFSEWCSRWCMLLNQSKTKTWAIHGAMVVSSVRILINHRLRTLGVKFDCKLTIGSHVHGVVSRVSQRIGILKWWV